MMIKIVGRGLTVFLLQLIVQLNESSYEENIFVHFFADERIYSYRSTDHHTGHW